MNAMRRMMEQRLSLMPDHKISRFFVDHGREYRIGPATFAGPRETKGQCYRNCTLLALRDPSLTYVEGHVAIFGLPIAHAWCATGDGTVIDPTLDADERKGGEGDFDYVGDYFGVPLSTDYVVKASLINGTYGVLDIMTARKTLPKLVDLGLKDGQQWLLGRRKQRTTK